MNRSQTEILDELRVHLKHLLEGPERVVGLPIENRTEERGTPPAAPVVNVMRGENSTAMQASPVEDRADRDLRLEMSFSELGNDAQNCRRCRLCEARNKVVFGVGNVGQPPIAFVGEGPGADEDRQGEPFVGKAGQLLTAAITKGMGLARGDVYICNVVKCRPPENRTPLVDEVEACTPFLFRQLELIKPQVIITLGAPAQSALTGNLGGITKIRGKWLEWRGVPLMPTFHPAYILRNPAAKKPFWEDLQLVMDRLGLAKQKTEQEQ